MKYRNPCKFLCNIVTVLIMLTFCASVCASEIKSITLLGDSISEGYGLSENDKNYGSWLGEYYDADVKNFAKFGKTTADLLDALQNNNEVVQCVKGSDLVCITIGANDVLNIFFDDLVSIRKGYTEESGFNVSSETIQALMISFSSEFGPAATQAAKNISTIRNKINEINPDARVVFQTIYNPFETSDESLKSMASTLYTFTAIYLSVINNSVRNHDETEFADIQHKFKGNCTIFTNIDNMDIHPNPLGHFLIAEEIVQKLKVCGNSDVLKDGLRIISDSGITDFPTKLKEEVIALSNGVFRKKELKPTMWTMEESTETTESTEKPSETVYAAEETTEKTKISKNYSDVIVISILIILMIAVASLILIKINKKNRSRI